MDVPDIKSKLDLLHIFRNPLKFTKTVAYLEKQIALYCQLAKSGNSRWRKFLQSIFTLNYLNDEIFNPENPSKVIAYFIELKVFLYISSEPSFRISVLPDLCGVVEVPGDNDDEDNSIFERRLNTLNRKVEDLESFFNEALQYLEEVVSHQNPEKINISPYLGFLLESLKISHFCLFHKLDLNNVP